MSSSTSLKPGDILAGKYRIEELIGEGGMGAVYAAQHLALEQPIAIKCLLPEALDHHQAVERFTREARAIAGIRSEHVVRVLDVSALPDGVPYIVMERLEGHDLKQHVQLHGPLDAATAAGYLLEACDAVAEAHGKGIVHRDLKPSNLFLALQPDGSHKIKVLDFGIATAGRAGSNAELTATDAILGSPAYMSPEQLRSAREADRRSDIWALGAILYELVSARLPFDADNLPALATRIVLEEPPPLVGAPEQLVQIVSHCLEKDPARRYQHVGQLARALEGCVPAGRASLVSRIEKLALPLALEDTAHAAEPRQGPISKTVSWNAGLEGSREPSKVQSVAAWGRTQAANSRSGKLIMAGGAALALVAGFLLVYGARTPDEAPMAPSAALAPPPLQSNPLNVSPIPTASQAPPEASAPGSSEPSPSATSLPKRVAPVASPRTPRCGAGQVLSKGHCCPFGTVWGVGGCKRPIATDPAF